MTHPISSTKWNFEWRPSKDRGTLSVALDFALTETNLQPVERIRIRIQVLETLRRFVSASQVTTRELKPLKVASSSDIREFRWKVICEGRPRNLRLYCSFSAPEVTGLLFHLKSDSQDSEFLRIEQNLYILEAMGVHLANRL